MTRRWRRVTAICAAASLALMTNSCSFVLGKRPPADFAQRSSIQCTTQNDLAVTDAILAVLVAPTIIVAGVFALSAASGFGNVRKCKAAMENLREAILKLQATPENERPDINIAAVAIAGGPEADTVRVGEAKPWRAAALTSSNAEVANRKFTWTSAAPEVATVSAEGVVSALAPGTARITASTGGIAGLREIVVLP